MRKPHKTPIVKASPDIKVMEPRISKLVIFICRLAGRIYLFLFYGIARIVINGEGKNLFNAFKRALAGESRCIIAFRHPNGGEPQLLSWFFLFKLRVLAAREGVKFARWPHAVFVYGYEVVRWGGWVARFIMPNVGAMPIHHSKIDTKGMARIQKAITEGPYPVAIAPEGQVSYTTDAIPRLEPGVIRIGFQAVERLAGKNETCSVEILPLSVHFHFGTWGTLTLERLLKKIEKTCGISGPNRKNILFTERVRQCRDCILEVNERRYQLASDKTKPFAERLDLVINAALETAERMMGVKRDGDLFTRMYWMRQFCWDQIFLPGVENFEDMPPIEQNVRHLKAGEAWYIGRHIEIVDFCWYFRVPLPTEETDFSSQIEYVQNLWDFANRTMGGAFPNRKNILPRRVIIRAAPVINLSERFPAYQEDKKAAIAEAMSDLEKAYIDCIADANRAERDNKTSRRKK